MRIFLCGGGSGKEIEEATIKFGNLIDKSKPLLYIPLAMKSEKYDSCLEWIKEEMNIIGINNIDMVTSGEDLYKKNKLLLNYDFDYEFDLIVSSIPKDMFNEKCLNKANRELIVNLSFLYEIDPINMADLIRASLNEKGNIERDELRRNAKKYYQFNNDNRLPSLLFKSQPEYLKNAEGDNSKRGKIINVFENTSPYEFLRAKYKGAKPTSRDMSILEELLIDVKLNPAVINVLIDYVLRTNNNKLVKSYVDTIAGQWKRSNIETALEAMQIAEKEHKKKYKKSSVSEVKKKKETVPAWFNEKIESSSDYENNAEFNSFLEEFRK